ncbi:hypothetical protein SPV_2545 [Streptococcus pneumoniae]|nr:hypothetical protein SPV_2545 [Streptococcus pneumoniae]
MLATKRGDDLSADI